MLKKIFNWILEIMSTPLFLGILPYKLNKKDWYFKKSDRDTNPSFPHLHCKDNPKMKMDIYTGEIYIGKNLQYFLKKDDFNMLWSDEKFIKDVKEIRATYHYNIEDLPKIPNVA